MSVVIHESKENKSLKNLLIAMKNNKGEGNVKIPKEELWASHVKERAAAKEEENTNLENDNLENLHVVNTSTWKLPVGDAPNNNIPNNLKFRLKPRAFASRFKKARKTRKARRGSPGRRRI